MIKGWEIYCLWTPIDCLHLLLTFLYYIKELLIFPLLYRNFLLLINSDTSQFFFFFNYIFIHEKVKNNRFTVGINIYKGTDNRILIDVKRSENRHGILV